MSNKSVIILFTLLIFGCNSNQIDQLKKAVSPLYPNESAVHLVEFYKIQVGAADFNLSTFGNPLTLDIGILANGEVVQQTLIKGTRGERYFDNPIQWIIDFSPNSNYQIRIEEQSVIADAVTWSIPGTPKLGYWPIALNNGVIHVGQETILYFNDKILPSKSSEFVLEHNRKLQEAMPLIARAAKSVQTRRRGQPVKVSDLVNSGLLQIDGDVIDSWIFDLSRTNIEAHSLFVDSSGSRYSFQYDTRRRTFGEIGERLIISEPK